MKCAMTSPWGLRQSRGIFPCLSLLFFCLSLSHSLLVLCRISLSIISICLIISLSVLTTRGYPVDHTHTPIHSHTETHNTLTYLLILTHSLLWVKTNIKKCTGDCFISAFNCLQGDFNNRGQDSQVTVIRVFDPKPKATGLDSLTSAYQHNILQQYATYPSALQWQKYLTSLWELVWTKLLLYLQIYWLSFFLVLSCGNVW